jgi:signal peptidase I
MGPNVPPCALILRFVEGTPLAKREEKAQKAEKKKETLPESIAGIASVLVSGIFIITFLVQAFEIPSSSMENTLLIGDHVFVDRFTPAFPAALLGPLLAYHPVRHDEVIVFLHPAEKGLYVVKRIIGIPGDHIHLQNGVVYRNGAALQEPHLNPDHGVPNAYRDNFPAHSGAGDPYVLPEWPLLLREYVHDGDLVVPPGYYFGMGDNRARSLDSRYWGLIPRENIIGRPLVIYWSFVTPPDQSEHTSLADRAAFLVHIVTHFFGKTRWGRMLHFVQ